MSLFRRLLLIAFVLVAGTLMAPDYHQARQQVVAVIVVLALLALCVVFLVGMRLARRIARLHRLAEGLPGGTAKDRPVDEATDELESLERSLVAVSVELQTLLDRLRFE